MALVQSGFTVAWSVARRDSTVPPKGLNCEKYGSPYFTATSRDGAARDTTINVMPNHMLEPRNSQARTVRDTYAMIKEEPCDETAIQIGMSNLDEDDEIIASYDIVMVNNSKFKLMSIAGLSNLVNRSQQYDASLRTDSKGIKIATKLNETVCACYTKEATLNLDRKSYAVKLSRETENAYFLPITSLHTISFLDEANKSNKVVDAANMIYEDCFKMPNPSRNKHDQLCIEMKPHLYKSLRLVAPDLGKQFLADLFAGGSMKRNQIILETTNNKPEAHSNLEETVDMLNCPHWQLSRVNLSDITQIESVELQIEALLRKGQVLTFNEIMDIITVESTKLLSVLPTIALLIRGNWVIKSNLLYKLDPFHDTETKQSHYKDLIAARDFLLWSLASHRSLTFAEIYPKFKKSPDHEEILNRLTVRSGLNEQLNFILPEDEGFLRMYPSAPSLQKNTLRLLEKHKLYLET